MAGTFLLVGTADVDIAAGYDAGTDEGAADDAAAAAAAEDDGTADDDGAAENPASRETYLGGMRGSMAKSCAVVANLVDLLEGLVVCATAAALVLGAALVVDGATDEALG